MMNNKERLDIIKHVVRELRIMPRTSNAPVVVSASEFDFAELRQAFANDVRLYLHRAEILALTDTAVQRFRRKVRNNPMRVMRKLLGVATIVLLALALILAS